MAPVDANDPVAAEDAVVALTRGKYSEFCDGCDRRRLPRGRDVCLGIWWIAGEPDLCACAFRDFDGRLG